MNQHHVVVCQSYPAWSKYLFKEVHIDTHQAYCLNFIALTEHCGRGSVAIVAAWALSVLGITLTVAAAWLIGELLSIGPVPINLKEVSEIELWVAIVATVLNYLRFFRLIFDAAKSVDQHSVLINNRGSGRALFALVAFFGPAAVVLIVVALTS
jgi:hypothetical protein